MFEVLGRVHHFAAGRLHLGEFKAKFVVAPTLALATNVKEKARHAVSKSGFRKLNSPRGANVPVFAKICF
jgi:hypothetical protein